MVVLVADGIGRQMMLIRRVCHLSSPEYCYYHYSQPMNCPQILVVVLAGIFGLEVQRLFQRAET